MPMSARENWLRAIEYRGPEWIPCSVSFAPQAWRTHRSALEEIVLAHPRLFPGHRAGTAYFFDEMPDVYREGEEYTDNWGCVWRNVQGGLEGIVIGHPLADWEALETYRPPDVLSKHERGDRDWEAERRGIEQARAAGHLTGGSGERLFDRLYFLRGFENLMMDFATDDPHLPRLIGMLRDHEMALVEQWLAIGVDCVYFHTDIGTQSGLMIHPEQFRRYVKPMFAELFGACRAAGSHVMLSSDGHVLEIVDDLIECGVSMHDPQLRANTLEGIVRHYKGKMCVNLDLDRQSFPFATPSELRDQVARSVEALYDTRGGLMLSAGVWGDDVPLANIEALCAAMEEFCWG